MFVLRFAVGSGLKRHFLAAGRLQSACPEPGAVKQGKKPHPYEQGADELGRDEHAEPAQCAQNYRLFILFNYLFLLYVRVCKKTYLTDRQARCGSPARSRRALR